MLTPRLTAGLEKTLRLLQGLSQIIIASVVTSPIHAAPWLQARKQFALGRRYLRFFRFVDAFAAAYRHLRRSSRATTAVFLDVGRWSFLGMYLFLESCTILDAMEVRSAAWAPALLVEANRLWFYSLIFSLASCLLQLYRLRRSTTAAAASTPVSSRAPGSRPRSKTAGGSSSESLSRALAKQILTDSCDLLVPGSVTGWARTSPAVVGLATVVSTLLASKDIWDRVQVATATAGGNGTALARESQGRRRGKV